MSKVICMGEALIDFMPNEKGFTPCAGGAPANVAASVAKLGGKSQLITKLGEDFFGDFLYKTIKEAGVDVSSVYQTDEANTGLAFVSHGEAGERSFLFYREPSADLLLRAEEVLEEWFESGDILHFCSVDLVESPMKKAHDRAIQLTKRKGGIVCFDPNVRLPLWKDHDLYKRVINEYIDVADILKISDEELTFITGIEDEAQALNHLLSRVKLLIYTKGKDGASAYMKTDVITHDGFLVCAIDTTGAGDAFIGSFLHQLISAGVDEHVNLSPEQVQTYLTFSNAVASLIVTRLGAISVMPSNEEVQAVINQ